jgi:PKD repeat protein
MTRHAKALLVRLITTVLAVAGVGLVTITTTPTAQAAPGDVGTADYQYGPPVVPAPPNNFIDPDNSPTASKPQSKLWFAQNTWWGVMQQPNTLTTSIHSFNTSTQAWTDTGVVVDSRTVPTPTQADTLWDGSKLYVASAGRDGSTSGIRVSRFTYDTATSKYVPVGTPQTINNGGVEAAVIAKDSTGRLWVAYTAGSAPGRVVRVVVSDTAQTTFGAPFTPAVDGTAVTTDDIATVVSHNGSISVVWSNQNPDATGATAIYAARHPDTSAPEAGWSASEKVLNGPSVADDHISLSGVEGNGAGSVFMIVKESADDPAHVDSTGLVKLVVLRPSGVWESYVHSTVGDDMTRPIILLEPSKGLLHVFATSPVEGGIVYKKTTSMDNPSFATGKGDPFIKLAAHTFINNPTSTKQNITAASGMLVLASDQKTGFYVHNYAPGSATPPPTKPVADFTYTPQSGSAPLAVQFTDKSTNASSVSWNFGDNTSSSSTRNPSHTYTSAGTYTVTLTATNSAGSATKSQTVTVRAPAPVASFTYTPTSGPAPLAVKFTDTSSNSPTSWAWDFGDGAKSTDKNPSHTFTKSGTYTVTLTARNATGSSAPKTATVTVGVSVPVASFTSSVTSGTAPLAVKFTDTSTGPPTSWAWTFGDGGTSTSQSPSYTFAKAGTYTVTLKVTNASGSNSKTATVTVAAAPSVPIVVLDAPSTTHTTVPFVDAAWHTTTSPTTVKSFDVQVSTIGSAKGSTWSTSVVAGQTGTTLRLPGRAGSSYCIQVRGTNVAGVVGAWSAARCTSVPLDDKALSDKGNWRKLSSSAYYMGSALQTRQRGATLTKTLTGKDIYLLVTRIKNGGKVKVYEGDRMVQKVSLKASKTETGQFVWITSHDKDTKAKYKVVVVSRGKRVIIDGLAVLR